MTFPLARPVGKGSRLAIIAPAGPFNEDAFLKGIAWLRERYEVTFNPDIFTKTGYLAGTDERRLRELNRAIIDPDIDAIVCARGGFGTTRILPGIDPGTVRDANKMLVGFSDISALHAIWATAGVRSMHAPMVAALGSAPELIREQWVDTLEFPQKSRQWTLRPLNGSEDQSATGILTGGNLAVLCSIIGTPYCPPLDNKILFIEDVGERPYRVDRMLTTMSQAGWFERIRGLVVGAFTEGEPGSDGVTIDEVIASHFKGAAFPVLTGFSAGHIDDNVAIPFGANTTIREGILETSSPIVDHESLT
ncbi:MAG TPA: LD-carboxypeptidase [Verrucomicrobiales bacterium]|nr:LD-carboxypeptidase [Verrucomicrobiales bacterium]